MTTAPPAAGEGDLLARVRHAVIWRSGSQIAAQIVAWASTFLVIRLLDPADYGLFAMTQVVLVFLNLMNGYGMASALIRADKVSRHELRQAFGVLVLLNGTLGLAQFFTAPLIADYYRQDAVGDLLRVQALLYVATPFTALAHAILSRSMDFRRPAQVRLCASLAGALTALTCALSGWGVWTLVAAPLALFYVEAIGMTWAARSLMWPSFRFRGAGALLGYGGAMMLVQLCWFFQSQADVMIAGRSLEPHALGIYTTALFLTQILASKFIPPLNEVAFAAYSRIQNERERMSEGFLKGLRLILLVTMPAYTGLAVTADPLVATMLGEKWLEVSAIVPILALAMPVYTLQIVLGPPVQSLGRPALTLRTAFAGALILPVAFLFGVKWGVDGLAWAWLAGITATLVVTMTLALPAIGVTLSGIARAAAPSVLAALAMAVLVATTDMILPAGLSAPARLGVLVAVGGLSYAGLLLLFARGVVRDAWALVRAR
jgi:O-antigen/teichoic acid export membrane protein